MVGNRASPLVNTHISTHISVFSKKSGDHLIRIGEKSGVYPIQKLGSGRYLCNKGDATKYLEQELKS